ncbi:hypothetical protein GQ600_20665 [Phytophthora cactorum]|nr:hypothetical protein GQ600_20665 [Phytophthora cactorum]
MKETSTNLTRTNPTAGARKNSYMSTRDCFPFSSIDVSDILEASKAEHRQLDRELYGDAKDPENTIAVKFRVSSVTNTGATVSMRQRLVARRYVKPDSFVYVWKLFVEGEGIFQGMHSDESGWCRLSPSTSQVGTSMEMLVRRSLMHYRSAERSGQATSHFDDIMRDSTNEDQKIFMQGLDQLLLDNALNGDSW